MENTTVSPALIVMLSGENVYPEFVTVYVVEYAPDVKNTKAQNKSVYLYIIVKPFKINFAKSEPAILAFDPLFIQHGVKQKRSMEKDEGKAILVESH